MDERITIKEAARILGRSKSTVYRLMRAGKLHCACDQCVAERLKLRKQLVDVLRKRLRQQFVDVNATTPSQA